MKAKKIIVTLLAAAMATSMLASCSGGNTDDNGEVTISVGNWPAKEGADLDRMNNMKAQFEEAHTNIKITPDTWAYDLKTFYPKAEAGMLPTIFQSHFTEFNKLVDGDYVAELTDVMKETGYWDNINPRLRELCSVDGKVYALPTNAYALGVSYNTKLFAQAGYMSEDGTPKQPKTWYELAEMAQHIKEVTGVPGFVLETAKNCGGWFMSNIGWSFGVDWMEQDKDGKWIATFDTPEAVEALQFIKDLKWKYNCVPANNIIDQEEATKLYATGQAAMVLDGPIYNRVVKYEMDPNDYGIMTLPAGPKKHVALLGGTLTCVPSNATEGQVKAAFEWFKFTGTNFDEPTDAAKENSDKSYTKNVADGMAIGVKDLSVWSDDSPSVKYRNSQIDKYNNININHVKLYNEGLKDDSIELQAEEPMCAQDLYGILDNLIQEVYTNENADCAALIKKANSDFQTNYLDNLDY